MEKDNSSDRTPAKLFFQLQQKVKRIGFDARNDHFKFDYVTLGKLLITIQPYFEELKLTYSQPLFIKDGKNALRTEIIDVESGEVIKSSESLLVIRSDNNPQDFGGAITYQRRYQLFSLLGLVGDKDDDCQLTNEEIVKRINSCTGLAELTRIFTSIPQEQQEDLKEEFAKKKIEFKKALDARNAAIINKAQVK